MNIKSYQVGDVQFQYSIVSKKWEFVTKGPQKIHTLLAACRGKDVAHKVAKTINGAIKRKGFIDNLCRVNVNQIVSPRVASQFPIRF